MMNYLSNMGYGTIIFNASALQEELGYSSGWQRILVQLVVACSLRLVDMGLSVPVGYVLK